MLLEFVVHVTKKDGSVFGLTVFAEDQSTAVDIGSDIYPEYETVTAYLRFEVLEVA